MTITEAARELGLTRQSVHTRLQRGQMRGVQVGKGIWLIHEDEVRRWKEIGRLKRGPKPRRANGEDQS